MYRARKDLFCQFVARGGGEERERERRTSKLVRRARALCLSIVPSVAFGERVVGDSRFFVVLRRLGSGSCGG